MKIKSLLFNARAEKFIKFFTNKWLWLFIIVLIGSYFRFANVYNRFSVPTDIGGDMEYYQMGEGLSKKGALIDPITGEITACRSIMYPAFIAFINTVKPESLIGNVRVAQAVLGVLAIIMVFFLGALIHSRVSGLIAAFLFAVNPIMIERVSWLWIESFYYFIVLGVAIWMIIWSRNPNLRNTVLFGLAIGISLMCRSSLFFLPFVLAGAYYFRPKSSGHVKKTVWLLLLFSYILLAPWVARNAYHFKGFIPFERNATGEDMYSASLGEIADQLDGPILQVVKKEKSDRIYREMLTVSIKNILENPGRYISSYFLRFSFIMGELKFLGILGESSILFYFFLLWGIFASLKSRKAAPLVLLLLYFIGIHIFMAVRLRHMFSIIPLFCVFVALGIASLIQKLGFLWKKDLLIEHEEFSSWKTMKKAGAGGTFSLFGLLYLCSSFFIVRELWICIADKPAAFAESMPVSQIANDAYNLETQQPIVHFVENYIRESKMVFSQRAEKPAKISGRSNDKQDRSADLFLKGGPEKTSGAYDDASGSRGGGIFISSSDSHKGLQNIDARLNASFMDKRDIDNHSACILGDKCAQPPTPSFYVSSCAEAASSLKLRSASSKEKSHPHSVVGGGMILIPSGKFQMGSRFWRGKFDEHPRHGVYLDDFFIDKYETTVAEYLECVKAGKCEEKRAKDGERDYDKQENWNHPISSVDWHQAKAYCQWLEKRLPTESEWEKAAIGMSGRKYPWGMERAGCEYAVIENSEDEENRSILSLHRYLHYQTLRGSGCGGDNTWPVGSKPEGASPYGVMDMIGNVSEWISDWYDEDYYRESSNKNPKGPLNGKYRVVRGHSFHNYAGSIRAVYRFKYLPAYKSDYLGFRCAVDGKE